MRQRATGRAELVYALGALDVDFGTEARRDVFVRDMGMLMKVEHPSPYDFDLIGRFVEANPEYEQGLTWILPLDATPVYAIRPFGTYAQTAATKKIADAFPGVRKSQEGEEGQTAPRSPVTCRGGRD